MTILYDTALSTKRLPTNHSLLSNSRLLPSKLNIKLKTHSLTSLNIPLETFVDFKHTSLSQQTNHQRTMAGSVDLISEIQHQSDNGNFSPSKPLINMASSDQQLPLVDQEWKQVVKRRFHASSSFIPTSLNDSVARLRRNRHLQNIHQTSLQAIDKITERKRRFSFSHNGPFPRFTFRNLSTSQSSSKSRMSLYISLPEIRSHNEQHSFDHSHDTKTKDKLSSLSPTSSWEKSSSWSWKSNDTLQRNLNQNQKIQPNTTSKEFQHQINDPFRSFLPVIIESPLQQRSSLQTIHQNYPHSTTKFSNMCRSSLSFRQDQIDQYPHRIYQKKNSFPHSISHYDVTPNLYSCRPTTRYPSTPLLTYSHPKNIHPFDYHPLQLGLSPMAIFDDTDDDDSDSTLSNNSFCSCRKSIDEFSEHNTTDSSSSSSSSSSESCFQDLSSTYDVPNEIPQETTKHTRFSLRHLCTLQ